MQTTAQANLCNSPPERSSTFRSLRWVKSTKNNQKHCVQCYKFCFTSSGQNAHCMSILWVWMIVNLKLHSNNKIIIKAFLTNPAIHIQAIMIKCNLWKACIQILTKLLTYNCLCLCFIFSVQNRSHCPLS